MDPAGPTISLISSEQVFFVAAALNACGYNEGLDQSSPIRKQVRAEMQQEMAKSEDARNQRDKVCLYIAQHRMTGTEEDIAQYISLALYLTPPPNLETTAELTEMPPDATQVADFVPVLKAFAQAVDLHGIWLAARHYYDEEIDRLHDPLSQMIVNTNLYLKMPASTYSGRRFIVVIEPMLSPSLVNARVYGSDYVVVVSPVNGKIPMAQVRHTYLHYVIEPLLYTRTDAINRMQPILKALRDSPLPYMYRSDPVPLTVECLIKAIEARTMDTGIPVYQIPPGVDRSQLPRYERLVIQSEQRITAARWAAVQRDMDQGYVLTQYFYDQLIQFEKGQASLSQTIGEMVYSMDIDQQVHRAHNIDFDQTADGTEVLQRSQPRKLTGLDLAEARLSAGNVAAASEIANQVLAEQSNSPQSVADKAQADFILARVAIMTGHAQQAMEDFQKTIDTSKESRLVSWSHIFLGRMYDLECRRDEALTQYKEAMQTRDGQLDTRLAAERGLKAPYAVNGHSCSDDSADASSSSSTGPPAPSAPAAPAAADPAPAAPASAPLPDAPGENGAQSPQ